MSFKIEISNFRKDYKDTFVQIDDLIIDDQITFLVGKNGSGKSTLIKAISGIIHYQGNMISETNRIAYMSELPVFPQDISVQKFLILLNTISLNPVEETVINDLLQVFRIDHKKEALLSTLSKGMKAKVNLIQCLMSSADIYLLDEPLSGLDREGIECLNEVIGKSNHQFVISTHLMADFINLKAKVIRL